MGKEKLTTRLNDFSNGKNSIDKNELYRAFSDIHPKGIGKCMFLIGWKLDKSKGVYNRVKRKKENTKMDLSNDISIYNAFKLLLETFDIQNLSIALAMMKLIEAEVGIGEKESCLEAAIAFIQRERTAV